MTDERWPRVKALFQSAAERPPSERDAFLAAATGEDEALRREVESLLTWGASDESLLDRPPPASIDPRWAHPVLAAGRRVGPYEIVAPLGAGAMGEVYRACDSTLHRDVALKVLPDSFASDPDRLARFTREAQTLAALNHPNIAHIHGFEDSGGVRALVMELVEGEDLSEQIARGPIPIDEVLSIARQIAEALEAAHEQGIIHRDLKPANIKVRSDGTVKVLDFGLAKAIDPRSSSVAAAALANSPTITSPPTLNGAGVILGTAAYMSPEQARGKALDRRTDIWSFGCVLYEMLTGRVPFAGDTISDTLVAILEREPDGKMLPADTPPPIRRLLRRCLEKDRKRRLDSASGARLEIDDAIASPVAETLALAGTPSRRVTPVAIAALAAGAVIAALVAWVMMRDATVAPIVPSRFAIVPSPTELLNSSGGDRDITLSPDGRYFVYLGGGGLGAGAPLMVRATDQLGAQKLPVGGLGVFSSPDSQWIGFFSYRELRKVSITGGAAVRLGPLTGAPLGASWGDDNTIVFATDDPVTGLLRVSADGGEPAVLTTPDAAQRESDHAFPSMLPGGHGVLFTILDGGRVDNAQVAVLDSRTGRRKTLVRGGSQAEYVDPSPGTGQSGFLIYAAAGTLRAVRFDVARLEVLGTPVTVVENVMTKPTGAANYAVSRQGTLFYVSGGVGAQMAPKALVWVDRSGHEEPINAPLANYGPPRISPDGTQLAFNIIDQEGADIWIWDIARETMRKVTFAPGIDGTPHWTPDGQRIIFSSTRAGASNVYSQRSDGTGTADRMTTSANPQIPTSIAPDGTVVGFETMPIPMASGGAVRTRLFRPASAASRPSSDPAGASPSLVDPSGQTLFDGSWPEFSPNGRYIAYQSAGSRPEIYVRPFPQVEGGVWQVSPAGGTRHAWSRSGRELFYLDASNTLTAVPVQTSGSTFTFGQPAKVFDARYATFFPPRHYDVSPDGQRFLVLKDSGDSNAPRASMVVVEHWFEELKRLVPSK